VNDWADKAAFYLVGSVPHTCSARWAFSMPGDVAAALQEAS